MGHRTEGMTGYSVLNRRKSGFRLALLFFLAAAALGGCGPAWSPVETRSGADGSYQLTPDGHYRVRRGDSLYTIAFRFGLDWRDLAAWNTIQAPYTIYPDQELRLSPPPSRTDSEVVIRPARPPATTVSSDQPATGQHEQVPVATKVTEAGTGSTADAGTGTGSKAPVTQPSTVPAAEPVAAPTQDPGKWLWPTEGRLLSTFKPDDPSRNGIEIGGHEGQPVIAAAAGEVVYSGNGLIGYGELIIVKHSDRMLSAYAHNRKRLVTEGQRVAAGEQLAEMGRDDRNQPMLHFEIRVNGTPQDPMKFLPGR